MCKNNFERMSKEYEDFVIRTKDKPIVYFIYSFDELASVTLKLSPDFLIEEAFPESRKLENNKDEYGRFIAQNIFPIVNNSLFIRFNRKTKTVETTVLRNSLFEKCIYFDVLDEDRLNAMAEDLDNYEMEIGEEIEDVVALTILIAGYMMPKSE